MRVLRYGLHVQAMSFRRRVDLIGSRAIDTSSGVTQLLVEWSDGTGSAGEAVAASYRRVAPRGCRLHAVRKHTTTRCRRRRWSMKRTCGWSTRRRCAGRTGPLLRHCGTVDASHPHRPCAEASIREARWSEPACDTRRGLDRRRGTGGGVDCARSRAGTADRAGRPQGPYRRVAILRWPEPGGNRRSHAHLFANHATS